MSSAPAANSRPGAATPVKANPPVLEPELVAVVASIPPDEVELVPSDELLLDVFELLLLELELLELLLLEDEDVCDDDPLVGPPEVVVLVLVGQGVVVFVYVGPVGLVDHVVDVRVTGDVYVPVPPPLPEPPELPADAGAASPISKAAKMHNPPATPAARIRTVLTDM